MDINEQSQKNQTESVWQYQRSQTSKVSQSSWFWQGRDLLTGQAIVSQPNGELLQAQKATNAGLRQGQAVSSNSTLQQLAINARNFKPLRRAQGAPMFIPTGDKYDLLFLIVIRIETTSTPRTFVAVLPPVGQPIVLRSFNNFLLVSGKIDIAEGDDVFHVTFTASGSTYYHTAKLSRVVDAPSFAITGKWAVGVNRQIFEGISSSSSVNLASMSTQFQFQLQPFFIDAYPTSPTTTLPLNQHEIALPIIANNNTILCERYQTKRLFYIDPDTSEKSFAFTKLNSSVVIPNLPYAELPRDSSTVGTNFVLQAYSNLNISDYLEVTSGMDLLYRTDLPFSSTEELIAGINYSFTLSGVNLTIACDLVYTQFTRVDTDRLDAVSVNIDDLTTGNEFASFSGDVSDAEISTYKLEFKLENTLLFAVRLLLPLLGRQPDFYSWESAFETRFVRQSIKVSYSIDNESSVAVVIGRVNDANTGNPVLLDPPSGFIDLLDLLESSTSIASFLNIEVNYNLTPPSDVDFVNDLINELVSAQVAADIFNGGTQIYYQQVSLTNVRLYYFFNSNIFQKFYEGIINNTFLVSNNYSFFARKVFALFEEQAYSLFPRNLVFDLFNVPSRLDPPDVGVNVLIRFNLHYEHNEPVFTDTLFNATAPMGDLVSYSKSLIEFLADSVCTCTLSGNRLTMQVTLKSITNLRSQSYSLREVASPIDRRITNAIDEANYSELMRVFIPLGYEIYNYDKEDAVTALSQTGRFFNTFARAREIVDIIVDQPAYKHEVYRIDIDRLNYTYSIGALFANFALTNGISDINWRNSFVPNFFARYNTAFDFTFRHHWFNPQKRGLFIRYATNAYEPSYLDNTSAQSSIGRSRTIECNWQLLLNQVYKTTNNTVLSDKIPLCKLSSAKHLWDGRGQTSWISFPSAIKPYSDQLDRRLFEHSIEKKAFRYIDSPFFRSLLNNGAMMGGGVKFYTPQERSIYRYDFAVLQEVDEENIDLQENLDNITLFNAPYSYSFSDYSSKTFNPSELVDENDILVPNLEFTVQPPPVPAPLFSKYPDNPSFNRTVPYLCASHKANLIATTKLINIGGESFLTTPCARGETLFPLYPMPIRDSIDPVSIAIFSCNYTQNSVAYQFGSSVPIETLNIDTWDMSIFNLNPAQIRTITYVIIDAAWQIAG